MAAVQSVEIGFEGGQVVSVRIDEGELKNLRKQLEKGGWHDLETDGGGQVTLYLGKVAFLRVGSSAGSVGFALESD